VGGNYFVVYPELASTGGGAGGATPITPGRSGKGATTRGIAAGTGGGGGGQTFCQIRIWQIGQSTSSIISYNQSGVQASNNCWMPVINGDATKCAYISAASNLISNSSGVQRVFRTTKTNGVWRTDTAVFTGSSGTCSFPTITLDGETIAYEAQTALKTIDVWVYNHATNTSYMPYDPATVFVGDSLNHFTTQPNLSPNGKAITFTSMHILTNVEDPFDGYDVNGVTEQVCCVNPAVYVKLLVDPYTITLESYRDAPVKHRRAGYYPCLSTRVEGNIEYYDLAFDSWQDNLVPNPAWPGFYMVYHRTEVASTLLGN